MEGLPQTQPGNLSQAQSYKDKFEKLQEENGRREERDGWIQRILGSPLDEAREFLADRNLAMVVTYINGVDQTPDGEEPFICAGNGDGEVYVHAVTDEDKGLVVGHPGRKGAFRPYIKLYRK